MNHSSIPSPATISNCACRNGISGWEGPCGHQNGRLSPVQAPTRMSGMQRIGWRRSLRARTESSSLTTGWGGEPRSSRSRTAGWSARRNSCGAEWSCARKGRDETLPRNDAPNYAVPSSVRLKGMRKSVAQPQRGHSSFVPVSSWRASLSRPRQPQGEVPVPA